ncbi:hypothetical protein ACFU5Y_05870 [Streptomyces gardneri]|uniref:hypothetical protein n=1 Tax=Streptomyces gardneri TaxID=66892 RepID=UPI0036AAE831
MSTDETARSDSGGSATAGGVDFQARVAAWFAAQALAGPAAAGVSGLYDSTVLDVSCETGAPVDDCRVRLANGVVLALQAKRSIALGTTAGSELGKTVAQFVEQHLWAGHEHDRLVLVTSSDAASTITTDLTSVLDRLREAPDGSSPESLFNARQTKAHTEFVRHVEREWKKQTESSAGPTGEQLRALLAQCWVWVLDVEEGKAAEHNAVMLLRTTVVADVDRAGDAWNALMQVGVRLSKTKASIDVQGLQNEFARQRIGLATVRDYRADVDRLTAFTEQNLAQMNGELTAVPGPDGEITVRRAVADVVASHAEDGSCLVTGDPGTGKSAVLHALAGTWQAAGRPVLFVQVGGLASHSTGQLQGELNLDHPLVDVLGQWSPGEPGLLVLDALDAARGGAAEELWRVLIQQIRQHLPRWRVVASVRSWDLAHSARLSSLIAGEAVVVGDWNDTEFAEITTAFPALAELDSSSAEQVQRLLRNPFHLRLAAQLLLQGAQPSELSSVDSRLDLLDRYWRQRVDGVSDGGARSVVVAEWCRMAVSARQLAVSAQPLLAGNTGATEVLQGLLSDRVLMPAGVSEIGVSRGVLGPVQFSHHVLFDYALAVAYFAVGDQQLAGRLGEDPDVLLFAHPSVDMYLELAWRQSAPQFWQLGLKLAAQSMPRMAAAAVAAVAVRCCRSVEELEVLLSQLVSGSAEAQALVHAVAVAVSVGIKSGAVADVGVWCDFAERLSRQPGAATGALLGLVHDLTPSSPETAVARGRAARALLAYLWTLPVVPQARLAMTVVIQTAPSAPEEAASLLRQALQGDQLADRGHSDLFALADAVPDLLEHLPDLVPDLYVAAMSYEEESTAPTQMGSGSVLTLVSTRQQDYGTVRYQLVESFAEVCRRDAARALEILTRLSLVKATTSEVHSGEVAGRKIVIHSDSSRVWDRSSYQGRDLVSLLDSFEGVAADTTKPPHVDQLLDTVAAVPQSAAVWRRLLKAAVRNSALASRLASRPISTVQALDLPDLLRPLAGLVGVLYPMLTGEEADRFAAAVRALKDSHLVQAKVPRPAWAADPYQRLVDALSPDKAPASLDADLFDASDDLDLAPAAWPVDARSHTAEAVDEEVEQLIVRVEEFTTPYDASPSMDAITGIEGAVRELFEAVESLTAPTRLRAELALAEAAERITRPLHAPESSLALAREVLLSMQPPQQKDGKQSERFNGIIPDEPCGPAARGLAQLSRLPGWYTPEVQTAITALSDHPVCWVRIRIARGAGQIAQADPATAWSILERFADDESDPWLLNDVLLAACLRLGNAERGLGLLARVAARTEPDDGSPDSVAARCAELAGCLWVFKALPQAGNILTGLRARWDVPGVWGSLLHSLKEGDSLTHTDSAVRARALDLFRDLAGPAVAALQHAHTTGGQPDSINMTRLKGCALLVDGIARNLCVAIGATGQDASPPSAAQLRVADEAADVIDLLKNASVPGVTHHLVTLYAHVLDSRPRQALLGVRDVLTAPGAPAAYSSDTLALDLCVSVVERVLADHRELLRTPECLTAVRQICDVFVDAGWPRAHQLVFGIEQVFR